MINFKQQLQEQLERATKKARDDGYQAGYAAAIRDLQELSTRAVASESTIAEPISKRRSVPVDYKPSPPRGNNAKLISDALRSIAPRSAGPTEIISLVKRESGDELPYSSTRHALDQLVSRGEAEQEGEQKLWRFRSPSPNIVGLKR